jgi:predicted heme/steroid binding protein
LTGPNEVSPPGATSLREFAEYELRKFDGSRGNPVYVAYNGYVYDLTTSFHWYTGMHRNLHFAGQDLTSEIVDAPHTDLVFRKFPIVGKIKG